MPFRILIVILLLTILLPIREANGAISWVQDVGTFSQYYGSGTDISFIIPVTASVASGNSVIVTLSWEFIGSGTATCSDNKSNSYTTDITESYGAAGLYTAICSSHNVTALTAGDTITVTISNIYGGMAATAHEFSGLASSSPLDQTASASGINTTTPSSGNTTVTIQGNELLIGAIGTNGLPADIFTPGSGYIALTSTGFTGTRNGRIYPEYKIVSATGAYQADGTLNPSLRGWAAAIATYKAAAASTTNITISGTLYSGEGTGPVSNQTIRLVVEGIDMGTDDTDASGNYSITATIAAGDMYIPLLVYVDGGSVVGTTVTVLDSTIATSINDLHIYADHLITRQDEGGTPLDTGDMDNAKASYPDTDILYSISWPDTTVTGADTELYVASGHYFTPFGNVTTTHMEIVGTLNAGNNTYMSASSRVFTVSGNWEHANGTFNQATSTVNFTGSGTVSAGSGSWWDKPFYNVTASAAGETTTILTGQGISVENSLVLGAGILAGGDVVLEKTSGTPLTTTNTTLNNSEFMYSAQTTGTVYIAAADYPAVLRIAGWTSGITNTFELAGNISCNSLEVAGINAGSTTILDTSVSSYSISCNSLEVGAGWDPAIYNKLVLNNSAVDINGAVVINAPDGSGNNGIDAGSATLNVSGHWINNDIFMQGTSSVILNGTGQQLQGDTTFYNLTKMATSADTLTFAASTTQTITGTATLQGTSGQLLGLRSSISPTQWHFNLATGAARSISYVDVQDSNASGSDSSQIDINPAYSINSGNNVSWFGNANITVAKSSTVMSDPVNGTTNPKRIPGAVVEYTILVTNTSGAQATNLTVTDDLSTELMRINFVPNSYDVLKGIQVIAPNINGGAVLNLTNTSDSDQGDYGITAASKITVGGITLDEGEQATIKFQVSVQ